MFVLVAVLLFMLAGAVAAVVVVGTRHEQLTHEAARLQARIEQQEAEMAEAACRSARMTASLGALDHGVVIFGDDDMAVYHNAPADVYLDARHGDALVEEAITEMAATGPGETREREVEVYGPPRRTLVLRAVSLSRVPGSASGDGAEEEKDAPTGVLVVIEDVTERRRLENVRRDFVANISHELKTPVGALALLAETLEGETDPEVMGRIAQRIVDESFRVARTIEDLLELSRLEAEAEQVYERLPVATFMDEAVERVRGAAERRDIDLRVTPPRDLGVWGERRQLVSAVANLLDNAVKYSDPGSPVELRAEASGAWVEVAVRDYGIGIPRRELERIFERFYRVDRARSRETGGTGLGLAIVRHVVSNHRGEVRVESREGEGSRFVLRLPAAGAGHRAAASERAGDASDAVDELKVGQRETT